MFRRNQPMEPRKKPRLMPLSGPDGFEKSPAQSKSKKISIPIPQFTSAFNTSKSVAKPPSRPTIPHSSLDPQLRHAVSSRPGTTVPERTLTRNPFPGANDPRLAGATCRHDRDRDPFIAYKDIPRNKDGLFAGAAKDSLFSTPHAPLLKKLEAPDLSSILARNAVTAEKTMRRVPSPPRFPPADEDYAKHKFTLSTTSIARATDFSTDEGNAELASILLRDQHPEIMQGDATGSEAQRGLNFSPRKKRYGQQGPQFIRGGLAARASQVLSRARTSVTLWQKEIETRASSNDLATLSASSASWPKPDLSMTIVKIVHLPSAKSNLPCFGIALCRVHLHSSSANDPRAHLSFNVSYHTLVKVLFSFATSPTSPQSAVRNPSHFRAGVEVLAWKPWREVKTTPSSTSSASPGHDSSGIESEPDTTATTDQPSRAPPTHMPASFPMSLTLGPTPEFVSQDDARIADTTLLCTRFMFVR